MMVTNCPMDMIANHLLNGQPPAVKWSLTIHRTVITFPSIATHYVQDDRLDLEFDSSAAQLAYFNLLFKYLIEFTY